MHVRRSIDIDFPETVSYPLRQGLMVHGAVADRTLPAPGVAAEEDGWTLTEEHEDIQDDVVFADGAWNENAAVFEYKDPLDTVLALDADEAADDEAMEEAEAAAVEVEAVDFPEVDADRKDEATLRDAVAEEVLVPAGRAPPTGWHVDRFPQGSGTVRLVSTPPWSLRPPTCEPELWFIIGKAAQREMRAKWQADDPDAFTAQEERRSLWRRAKRGGVVAGGIRRSASSLSLFARCPSTCLGVQPLHHGDAQVYRDDAHVSSVAVQQ